MTTYPGKRADMLVEEQEPSNPQTPQGVPADSPVTPRDAFYTAGTGLFPSLIPRHGGRVGRQR